MEEDDLLAEMLEDFAKLSGEDLGDILAEGFEAEETEKEQESFAEGMLEDLADITGEDIADLISDFEVFPVYEEPEEGEPLEMDSDAGDTDEYFDDLFEDMDIDADEELDPYSED